MHKKKLLFVTMTFGFSTFMFIPKNTYAITSNDYSSRNVCNSKYELAKANSNYTISHISCYNDYSSALNAMNSSNDDDLFILDSTKSNTKIVNAKYALLDLSVNPEQLTYFYETPGLTTRKYTYMDTGSLYGGVDGALLDVNYGTSIKVKIGGLSAWIKDGTYEIVPLNWVKSSSSYTVGDSIKHNYVAKIQNDYTGHNGSVIGPKPEQLSTGTYYSYDGHYFYTNRKTMLKDYKNGNYNNSVNKNDPYYNYYMYLSTHSKTNYSSRNIDEYIRNNLNFKYEAYSDKVQDSSSKMYGQGSYFYNAQQKNGVNAILSLSLSRNESANGRSEIVWNKNNGFGLKAYDSNPSQSASWYPTYASSVYEFAYHWVTDGFADPSDTRYFGPAFGDGLIGMNVKYAADTYWSEKMAANYYSFDSAKGMQDYNYYQLGLANKPTNAYMSPSSSSQVVYEYPEEGDNVIIIDEINNSEGTWYKLQSDKIINGNTITTLGDYNWNSYVYVKKENITKINKAKNGYKSSNDVTKYKDAAYSYDLYIENATLKPKVAIIDNDVDYYFDSTLEEKTGHRLLKDKWVMVYAEAKNESGKTVSYLVTSNYNNDQKHWIKAGNMHFQTTGYGKVTVTNKGYYTWVNSNTEDTKQTLIGGLYTNTYVPLVTSTNANGYTWYKVPSNLEENTNSFGWTIANGPDASFEFTMYNADEDNKNINITSNNPPVITANDKEIIQGNKFDELKDVKATDEEDGDITSKVTVSGKVDTEKVGTYKIVYEVIDSKNEKSSKEINVTVKENNKPEIIATDKEITINHKFDELKDVTAKDEEDGDITEKIKVENSNLNISKEGTYEITYSVTDSYNQKTTKKINVEVVKDKEPVINAKDQTLNLNDKFDELKDITASDSEDGDLTSKIMVTKNEVDTSKEGIYEVEYQVKDSYGNEISKTVKITVTKVKLEKKSGEFYLDNLKWNKDKKQYEISGYLIILNENNEDNAKYEVILVNKNNNKEYSANVDSWVKDTPYDLGKENGKDYSNSWFKGLIDLKDIPSGDYDIYMKASKGKFYSKEKISNIYNKDIDKRQEDDTNGYNFNVLLSLKSKEMTLNIRKGGLITTKTANTYRNMINDYDDITFENNELHLIGTSYDYDGTYSDPLKITRKLIFENMNDYKKYSYELGSTNNGSYKVTSKDNKDKSFAWYDKKIDISNLPKGKYIMYVYTKTFDSEDYGEIKDLFGIVKDTSQEINNKKYTIHMDKDNFNRITLIVE